jgi:hypothetical protein
MTGDAKSIPQQIDRLELRLGVTLPPEYRAYVRSGMPWDDRRRFLKLGEDPWRDVLDIRCGPHLLEEPEGSPGVSVHTMLDIYEGREAGEGLSPRDAIEVADCNEGIESIFLFVRGSRRGQVWLKDWGPLERDEAPDVPEVDLRFLASNFNDFLAMLVEDPRPPDPDAWKWAESVTLYCPHSGWSLIDRLGKWGVFATEALQKEYVGQHASDGCDSDARLVDIRFAGPDAERLAAVLISGQHQRRVELVPPKRRKRPD